MNEVIGRRLERAKNGDESFLPLPDLMLIDGGKGQTHIAWQQVMDHGMTFPVLGMVKDDHHRTRALVTPEGREIGITATPQLFAFVGRIQEETHRFAIEFHRSSRSKTMRKSQLDGIEGLGPERRKKLLDRFGSIKAVKAADIDDIAAVVPRNVAENIKAKLGEEREKDESDKRQPQGTQA